MTDYDIKKNLNNVLERIRKAESKSGRSEGSVKLLAVSKFHPESSVLEAVNAGQLLFGENRVQEAYEKFSSVIENNPLVKLHIIGQLQTNKVKKACQISSVIQSVDRLDLIKEIENQISKMGKTIDILFEIHTGEESKSGFRNEDDLLQAMEYISSGNASHVIPKGFMTMAPFTEDRNIVRKSFESLRLLSEKMKNKFPNFALDELSMGMSGDFETAIEEGSTMVRVGTSIFGEREY